MADEPILEVLQRLPSRKLPQWTTTTEPGYQHGYWGLVLSAGVEDANHLLEIRALRASTEIYGIGITVRTEPRTSVPERLGSGPENATQRVERYNEELKAYRHGLRDLAGEDVALQMAHIRIAQSLWEGHGDDPGTEEIGLRSLPAERQGDDALGFLTHVQSTEDVLLTAVELIWYLLEKESAGFRSVISEVRNRHLVPDNWEDKKDALPMIFSLWSGTVNLERNALTLVHVSHDDDNVGRISCELWSSEVSLMAPPERRMSVLWSEYFAHKGLPRFHVREGTHRAAVVFDAVPLPAVPLVELRPEEPVRSFAAT